LNIALKLELYGVLTQFTPIFPSFDNGAIIELDNISRHCEWSLSAGTRFASAAD